MWFFFFQAEDGIRDLVRSRGLGDVYKRQKWMWDGDSLRAIGNDDKPLTGKQILDEEGKPIKAVSYTHLTLPTSDLV